MLYGTFASAQVFARAMTALRVIGAPAGNAAEERRLREASVFSGPTGPWGRSMSSAAVLAVTALVVGAAVAAAGRTRVPRTVADARATVRAAVRAEIVAGMTIGSLWGDQVVEVGNDRPPEYEWSARRRRSVGEARRGCPAGAAAGQRGPATASRSRS